MKKILSVLNVRTSDQKTIESGVLGKELMCRSALGVYM